MKRFSLVLIPVAATLLAVSACEDSTEDGDLALYLLADDTLNAVEVYNIDLDSLTLADQVGAAVAHVGHPCLSFGDDGGNKGSAHALEVGPLVREAAYEGVGAAESISQ